MFFPAMLFIVSISLITPGMVFSAEKSVIVGFHGKPGPSERALIRGNRGRTKRSFRLINAMAVTLPEEEIEKLKKDKNVAYVEENALYWASEDPPPNQEYTHSWGVTHIGGTVAHTTVNKGTGIKIAVIDTGIDYTHEDLSLNYAGGYDFVFDDDDPFDDNSRSHGTHVAGIIAAEENGIGVIGVAPEADIYALKVLDGGGFGLEEWIIAAIEWAVDNQIDIVNLSLEGPHRSALRLRLERFHIRARAHTYRGRHLYRAGHALLRRPVELLGQDIPA